MSDCREYLNEIKIAQVQTTRIFNPLVIPKLALDQSQLSCMVRLLNEGIHRCKAL